MQVTIRAALSAAVLLAPLAAQTDVVSHGAIPNAIAFDIVPGAERPGMPTHQSFAPIAGIASGASSVTAPLICGALAPVRSNQTFGTQLLQPQPFLTPAVPSRDGKLAFFSNLSGGSRNHGIFLSTPTGIRAIAIGCGPGAGSGANGTCGDPAPGGGTFGGFFSGTFFAPAVNEAGDVVFLADVVGGPSSRALFLYRAATQTIVRVVALGDACPTGGTFLAIGPGVINSRQEILFLGMNAATLDSTVFAWRAGSVTKVAAAGDPAPQGGTFSQLGTESLTFVDGTRVPVGPLPAINDCGHIVFRASVSGGITTGGIVLRIGTSDRWFVKNGDATPAGGTYLGFQGANLNGNDQIAVFADFTGPGGIGWFYGGTGSMRAGVVGLQPIDGGTCTSLAFSRNPMKAIDDQGNLLQWIEVGSGQSRLVYCDSAGSQRIALRRGDATPIGGTYSIADAWPSLASTGRLVSGWTVLGGSSANGYFVHVTCAPTLSTAPCATIGGTARIDNQGPAGGFCFTAWSDQSTSVPFPPYGTLLIGPAPIELLSGPSAYPGLAQPSSFSVTVPAVPGLVGLTAYLQTIAFATPADVLTNQATITVQ